MAQAGVGAFIVAAIDFGTTYSSFAYSFLENPKEVQGQEWNGAHGVSPKCPTCVLLEDNDGDITLKSFGYAAEKEYSELLMEGSPENILFFRRFKMMLFESKTISKDITLRSTDGKTLPALQVFELSIKFLKDQFMDLIKNRITGLVQEQEVHWVITVPAIWNNRAKGFMRDAAQRAGIPREQLTIALEPEAGSLCCRHLSLQKAADSSGSKLQTLSAGTKYILLDAGGGTVDIAVHEVLPDEHLRELYPASGGDWGGVKVDESFTQLLVSIVGEDIWKKFRTDYFEDYIDLFGSFEIKKRAICPSVEAKFNIHLPLALNTELVEATGKSVNDIIQQIPSYAGKIKVNRDKMILDSDIAQGFFTEPVTKIVHHLQNIIQKPRVQGCSCILMVGGFSESPMLKTAVKDAFPHLSIITPHEAGMAILKGAVFFGHDPKAITERVCRYTFGVSVMTKFIEGEHAEQKKKMVQGKAMCGGLFHKHVTVGDVVKVEEVGQENHYQATCGAYVSQTVGVYASTETDPKYVTDTSCFLVGTFQSEKITYLNKTWKLGLMYGGTEIRVRVTETETGKEHFYTLDLPD